MMIKIHLIKACLKPTIFSLLCICPAIGNTNSTINIKLDGSCQQITESFEAGKNNPSLEDSLTIYSYRGLVNGQVTIYNHALALANHDKFIPQKKDGVEPKPGYFLKKIIAKCEETPSEQRQVYDLTTAAISEELEAIYRQENIILNFKRLAESGTEKLPTGIEIGLGKDNCKKFHETIEEKPFLNSIYRSWAAGYLTPFMLTKELEPEKSVEMVANTYDEAFNYCKTHSETVYAEAVRQAFIIIEEHY